MPDHKALLRGIRFVCDKPLDYKAHYQSLPGVEDMTPDTVNAILEGGAKLCKQVIAPLNRVGGLEDCTWSADDVKTPTDLREAYQQSVEGGQLSLAHDAEHDSWRLLESPGLAVSEMVDQTNRSQGTYPDLPHGATDTLHAHDTAEQQVTYLTRLVSGGWASTMCLTEPHCDTDLGMLCTKAEPQADSSCKITGIKIFIPAGEHDMTDNIVHTVLARPPDVPQDTKGVPLFVVSKFLSNARGNAGGRNMVSCDSIEHKMSIHGNVTYMINSDTATGFLIGPSNKGLNYMFTFMNAIRLGTVLQGLVHAEVGLQGGIAYACERLQMRSLTGSKAPERPVGPIIVYPDVRCMLLTMKVFAEGNRVTLYFAVKQVNTVQRSQDEGQKKAADPMLAFLMPIAKAPMAEVGFGSTNHGVQAFGGHDLITEYGMKQNARGSHISMLYEGITGVQVPDLLDRRMSTIQGEALKGPTKIVYKFCQANEVNEIAKEFVTPLAQLNKEWGDLTMRVGMAAMKDHEEAGAALVDYLIYSGYTCLVYFRVDMARLTAEKLAVGTGEEAFYKTKLQTARFYFQYILSRTRTRVVVMLSGVNNLTEMVEEDLAFGY